MLVFDEPSLRIYAAPLSGGGLHVARISVLSLLDEAFPGETVSLSHTPDGVPFLDGAAGNPAISISHSSSQALLAVSRSYASVGIDTETADRDRQLARVMRKYLTIEQQQEWGASALGRLVAWCIKEAIYKCVLHPGLPLTSIPLPEIGFLKSGFALMSFGERRIGVRLLPDWEHNGPIVAAWYDKPCRIC